MRMRMKLQTVVRQLTGDEIRQRLRQLDEENNALQAREKHLAGILDTLTVSGAADDRETVALDLARVTLKRESLTRVKAALRERQLDAAARMMAVRFLQTLRDLGDALAHDRQYADELRNAIKACGTLYRKKFRPHRATLYRRLANVDALPEGPEQRTQSQSSILYNLADAFDDIPELVSLTQPDTKQRPRWMGLRQWGVGNLVSRAVHDGTAMRAFYKSADEDTIRRVKEAVRDDPRVVEILNNLTAQPRKHPTHTAARQKHKKSVKRGKRQ